MKREGAATVDAGGGAGNSVSARSSAPGFAALRLLSLQPLRRSSPKHSALMASRAGENFWISFMAPPKKKSKVQCLKSKVARGGSDFRIQTLDFGLKALDFD